MSIDKQLKSSFKLIILYLTFDIFLLLFVVESMPTSQILPAMDPLIPNSSGGLLTPTNNNQQNRNSEANDRNLNVSLDDRGAYADKE